MKTTHDTYRERLEDLLAGLPARDVGPRHAVDRDVPDPQPEAARPEADAQPRARPPLVLGRSHLSALGVVLVLVLTVVAVMLLRSRATVVPIAASVTPAASAPSAATASSGTAASVPSSPAATIRVHVTGRVARPDVYPLASGARVVDAVRAAGGLAAGAHPGTLNLAAPVCDGCQVQIPASGNGRVIEPDAQAASTPAAMSPGASPGAGATAGVPGNSSDQRIDLNTATSEQLQALDGVGPATAAKILAWRQTHGRFTDVSELQEIDGIGPKTFARIKDHVRV